MKNVNKKIKAFCVLITQKTRDMKYKIQINGSSRFLNLGTYIVNSTKPTTNKEFTNQTEDKHFILI